MSIKAFKCSNAAILGDEIYIITETFLISI